MSAAAEHIRPVGLGAALGALNVIVIGVALSAVEGAPHLGIAMLVMMIGMVPGVVLGAGLGYVAGAMSAQPEWLRRFVLAVPALLLVVVLAEEFDMQAFVLVSCIPTGVAVLLLERGTRRVVPPPVPVAQARRA